MRISDWSSDVCSSDLTRYSPAKLNADTPRSRSLTISARTAGGAERCGQSARVHARQPSPIGAASPARSIPRAAVSGAPSPARSEEHTSELQSLMRNSYAVFCLKKKKHKKSKQKHNNHYK